MSQNSTTTRRPADEACAQCGRDIAACTVGGLHGMVRDRAARAVRQQRQLAEIDNLSRGPLGSPNPVAPVACPHCGGRMEAIDARKHVVTA